MLSGLVWGLFMPPGAAGEDWVRPRAWWGTVARLRVPGIPAAAAAHRVSANAWEGEAGGPG